ncbi:CBASS cGAMP synthase [Bradyrhizobium sp. SZCCHNRI3042]|uniref:CBASS cGAMP synthase n=1 Tax=Bradyrhizobium sp. SZCCHNRI3042 TaxID=3057291 RepID=UPI0029161ABF|nr:CBASS cGAMP synthase [Bradyrhizobium sp. SZCCHNRI3042]
MALLNLHRVFTEAATKTDFLSQLTVPERREQKLRNARDAIRDTLRVGFSEWQLVAERRVIMEASAVRKGVPEPKLRPKFRMQGSASQAYRTLNDPAHPPQQIDYDDGVYLPVSFLAETGNPVIAASGYYQLVEKLLQPLVDKRGWSIDTTTKKCVRIVLDDHAHIDLPLYAMPDQEFTQLAEDVALAKRVDRSMFLESATLDDEVYERLREDELRLALREGEWIPSDPRLLENWFKQAVADFGPQVRRVSRYLKGWRDFVWIGECRLSSIIIMKCVVDAFDELRGTVPDNRDDIAVLEVASRLDRYFAGDIPNPVLDMSLNDHWSPQDRADFRQRATELHQRLRDAVRGSDSPSQALATLARAFGPRIPQTVALVSVTAEATVRSYQPSKLPAREVPRTKSG